MSISKDGLLAGVRVIDMTSVVFGPLATQMLGDLGADVIKVESPEGDMLRQVQPARTPGTGAAFPVTNRNKRSIALDLQTETDRADLLDLLDDADVLCPASGRLRWRDCLLPPRRCANETPG